MDMEQLEIEGLDIFQSLTLLAERLVELTGENKWVNYWSEVAGETLTDMVEETLKEMRKEIA